MRYGEIICERASDDFILSVCDRIFDVAADKIARADRPPQNVNEMPKIAIHGDIFSEEEADSMEHGYRAFALSGFDVVFVDPRPFPIMPGYTQAGLYAGWTNQGDIEIALSQRDFADLAYQWWRTWPRQYSSRRIEMVRRWLERLRETLVHEVRHAFDSTSSEDKYRDNKRAVLANRLWIDAMGRSKDDPVTQAAFRSYMRSSHEISARFSQAVAGMQNRQSMSWEEWRGEFIKKFQGFDLLSPKDRRKLNARMYQVWQNISLNR